MFFYMVHSDTDHLADAAAVEDFDFVELGAGNGPSIASPEENIDGGSNK